MLSTRPRVPAISTWWDDSRARACCGYQGKAVATIINSRRLAETNLFACGQQICTMKESYYAL